MTQPDRFQSFNYYSPPPSPPPSLPGSKISPAVLFAIVILALLFFVSALLHLLVRLLTKHPNSSSSNGYPQGQALQRQLQQLFNLNDSGLEQAFIDALPVFLYGEAVLGAKEPFDCAVCLTEFSDTDKLRLLPTCSHAFHISCIDTWLLSNSTCPLCRAMLFAPGFPMENPIFEVDAYPDEEDGSSANVNFQKRVEIEEEEGALSVRLGKFRKLDGGDTNLDLEEASDRNVDARRCYSMGSYEYVLGDTSLKVALCPNQHRKNSNSNLQVGGDSEGSRSISRGDSYSVSKIWLWPKKGDLSGDARIERTWDV